MKNWIRTGLAAVAAVALLAPAPVAAEDLTLEQVLERYQEAVGGVDAWDAVQSMKQTGTMQMMGMEAPFTVWTKRPNRMRVEFTMQGMTGVQAFDGEKGWMVMPFMGSDAPQPLPEEASKAMATDADLAGPLMHPEQKGHKVTLAGKEDVEGTEAYRLDVELKSGNEISYFLDAEYFVPIRTVTTAEFQGTETEVVATLSDYKEVDGLMVAHSVSTSNAMGEQVMTIDAIELNPEIEDERFVMPKASTDAPDGESN